VLLRKNGFSLLQKPIQKITHFLAGIHKIVDLFSLIVELKLRAKFNIQDSLDPI
jgi:hypothetical protein